MTVQLSEFKGRRFLVVGGAGFIGSHITDRLLEMGSSVVVLDDFSNGKETNLPSREGALKLVQGDVRTFNLDELGKFDCVFNEAARALIPSFKDPMTDLDVNAGGAVRVLEYARRNETRIVQASSGSVYGNPLKIPISEDHPLNPISPYAVSKLASEFYCSMFHREFGLNVVALRYFNVYGPRQTASEEMGVIPIFVKKALRNESLRIFGDGKQTRDFLHVSDVVNANLLAYTNTDSAGRIMNVGGGGKEISIDDLAAIVMKMCSSTAPIVHAKAKAGDIRRLVADNSLAESLIGYKPKISLEEGLKIQIEFARTLPRS